MKKGATAPVTGKRHTAGPAVRRRRTAAEARRVILDAAERRLREGGPEAIRLQDIAADVGIAHPTILHHFESRDGLIEALQARAIERLEAELVEVLVGDPATEETAVAVIEGIFSALADTGLARLLAWRALANPDPDEGDRQDPLLRDLTDLVHKRRVAFGASDGRAVREDSEFIVRLTAVATLGEGIFGPILDYMTGHDEDPAVRRRFRAWYAKLLLDHLDKKS